MGASDCCLAAQVRQTERWLLNAPQNLMAPLPPAALRQFSGEKSGISRSAHLCPICARLLLIWQIWTIWCDGRTITYEESAGGQIPIPSLATMGIASGPATSIPPQTLKTVPDGLSFGVSTNCLTCSMMAALALGGSNSASALLKRDSRTGRRRQWRRPSAQSGLAGRPVTGRALPAAWIVRLVSASEPDAAAVPPARLGWNHWYLRS